MAKFTPTTLDDVDRWIDCRNQGSTVKHVPLEGKQYSRLTPRTRGGWWSFEKSRDFVRSLGFPTVAEYRLWLAGKRPHLPPRPENLPSNPDQAYQHFGWLGYTDYLKTPLNRQHLTSKTAEDWPFEKHLWINDVDPALYYVRDAIYTQIQRQASRLTVYYLMHGHARVPQRHPIWRPLSKFLDNFRADSSKSDKAYCDLFTAFLPAEVSPWDTQSELPPAPYRSVFQERWLKQFHRLELFKQIFGHIRIPLKPWPENHDIIPLARWLNQQRVRWGQGNIQADQLKMLEDIGFTKNGNARKLSSEHELNLLDIWVTENAHLDRRLDAKSPARVERSRQKEGRLNDKASPF